MKRNENCETHITDHSTLTCAAIFAMFCLVRFTVGVTVQEDRVRNQFRKGSMVVVNFMSSWVCECIVRLLRRRRVVTFDCRRNKKKDGVRFSVLAVSRCDCLSRCSVNCVLNVSTCPGSRNRHKRRSDHGCDRPQMARRPIRQMWHRRP